MNAFGDGAALSNTGSDVNAFGTGAAVNNSGDYVNAFGRGAAVNNSGSFVNAFGYSAAANNSGNNCTFIGSNPNTLVSNISDNRFIVYSTDDTRPFMYGDTSDNQLSIGTSNLSANLNVSGSAYFTGELYDSTYSAGTPGQILTTTGTSTAWASASSIGANPIGNTLRVDAVYGNDTTALATPDTFPFLTINAAVNYLTSLGSSASGKTIWIFPGTYTLTSGITLPNGTSIRGLSLQTVTINLVATGTTTMITMGENCRVEDVTLNLTSSTNATMTLTGILFGGTSSQTSKLRTSVVTVNNSSVLAATNTNVYGVNATGTGALDPSVFSFNSVKGCTINVRSNGAGVKRGILISGSNQMSTRDTNIFVAQPTNTASTGSYIGIETNEPATNTGSIQIRSTTVGVVVPIGVQAYTASDILQTTPSTITDPSYLASSGIQIGPGSDLVTKSAGSKGFSTYVYPTIICYGLKGDVNQASTPAYLWAGTQSIANNVFPDPSVPPAGPIAFFRVQQPALLSGLSVSTGTSPGAGNQIVFTVYYTPISTGIAVPTPFTAILDPANLSKTFYNASVRLNTGDKIHLQMTYTGNNGNTAHDISAQIDLF